MHLTPSINNLDELLNSYENQIMKNRIIAKHNMGLKLASKQFGRSQFSFGVIIFCRTFFNRFRRSETFDLDIENFTAVFLTI